jgi:hypothetical protein
MSASKTVSLRTAAAVLFTSVVAPVLVSMVTQEATSWQKALHRLPEDEPAAATADERPRAVQPPRATTGAKHAESSPAKTSLGRKVEEWLSPATARGR